jgi:hypothetical protein
LTVGKISAYFAAIPFDFSSMRTLLIVGSFVATLWSALCTASNVDKAAYYRYAAESGPIISPADSDRREDSEERLASSKTEYDRWVSLGDVALRRAGKKDSDGAALANELLAIASQDRYRKDWNYGNAIHKANSALGRIALRNGDKAAARKFLLASVDSKGSPQMNSFGPNMVLAYEMLDAGEQAAVLEYLAACRVFWKMGEESLNVWEEMIRAGKKPRFGSNMLY